jgi:CheY-like chemotaxis protein
MHTLVAHDDPGFLVPLATALRCAGYTVTACDNGMSAWDDLNRSNVDLLITQIQFPYPQPDGIALAVKARSIQRDIRVVFMAGTELHPHPGELGTCLTSPVSVAQVLDAVVNAPS